MKRAPTIDRLTSIVAHARHGAIGAENRLPWRVRSDMRFFRDTTVDNVVIMGKRTYSSLGGCLPKRLNVVVTHGFELSDSTPDCRFANGIAEALLLASSVCRQDQEVFVVGGATMYDQFIPFVDRYLVTEIDLSVPDADTFFNPEIVAGATWSRRVLCDGMANDEGDEANFQIVEYAAVNPSEFLARRREAIDSLRHQLRPPAHRRSEASAPRIMDRLPL